VKISLINVQVQRRWIGNGPNFNIYFNGLIEYIICKTIFIFGLILNELKILLYWAKLKNIKFTYNIMGSCCPPLNPPLGTKFKEYYFLYILLIFKGQVVFYSNKLKRKKLKVWYDGKNALWYKKS